MKVQDLIAPIIIAYVICITAVCLPHLMQIDLYNMQIERAEKIFSGYEQMEKAKYLFQRE